MPQVTFLTPYNTQAPTANGRGERHTTTTARAVARATAGRWNVELCVYGPQPGRELLEPGLALRVLQANNNPIHRADGLSWEMLDALEEANVVHVYGPFTHGGSMALALGASRRLPMCVTEHAFESKRLGWELGAAELAEVVIANCPAGAARIPTQRPVRVVPVGVDTDFFCPPPDARPRQDILLAAQPDPAGAVEALRGLLPREVELTLEGDGTTGLPERGAQQLGNSSRAQASMVQLRSRYQGALATVVGLPMHDDPAVASEWSGLSMLESMACGTPVICVRTDGVSAYVQDGRTGWLVDDLDQLRLRLLAIFENPSLAAAAGRAGRKWVEQAWNLESTGTLLMEVYESLVA